jgi:hypothetical protein
VASDSSSRRAGYAAGVIAAADALMADLEDLRLLDDAEEVQADEDGTVAVCSSCEMRRIGYTRLATRFEFALSETFPRDGGG